MYFTYVKNADMKQWNPLNNGFWKKTRFSPFYPFLTAHLLDIVTLEIYCLKRSNFGLLMYLCTCNAPQTPTPPGVRLWIDKVDNFTLYKVVENCDRKICGRSPKRRKVRMEFASLRQPFWQFQNQNLTHKKILKVSRSPSKITYNLKLIYFFLLLILTPCTVCI